MSPAGIPLFYGALGGRDRPGPGLAWAVAGKEAATIARFTNSALLAVIDLAGLPDVSSILDAEREHLRAPSASWARSPTGPASRFTSERSDTTNPPSPGPARSLRLRPGLRPG